MPKSQPIMLALIALAVVFVVAGVLYQVGALQVFTRTGSGNHTTHAVVMAVLAVAALIAANFARPQSAG